MKVTVLHNISRDSWFGLNQVPADNGKRYEPRSHELVKVFEFDLAELPGDPGRPLQRAADDVFRAFNVGDDPQFSTSDAEETLALRYRARRLRSLSSGDVLIFDGAGALSAGERVDEADLNIIADPAEAERIVRDRYDFLSTETLSVTVPLA